MASKRNDYEGLFLVCLMLAVVFFIGLMKYLAYKSRYPTASWWSFFFN